MVMKLIVEGLLLLHEGAELWGLVRGGGGGLAPGLCEGEGQFFSPTSALPQGRRKEQR